MADFDSSLRRRRLERIVALLEAIFDQGLAEFWSKKVQTELGEMPLEELFRFDLLALLRDSSDPLAEAEPPIGQPPPWL